jgi:hypothetical protein
MAITQTEFDAIVEQIEVLLNQPQPQGKILTTDTPLAVNIFSTDDNNVTVVLANSSTSLSFKLVLWESIDGKPMGYFYNTRYSARAMVSYFLEHINNKTTFNQPIDINDESFGKFETANVR